MNEFTFSQLIRLKNAEIKALELKNAEAKVLESKNINLSNDKSSEIKKGLKNNSFK